MIGCGAFFVDYDEITTRCSETNLCPDCFFTDDSFTLKPVDLQFEKRKPYESRESRESKRN